MSEVSKYLDVVLKLNRLTQDGEIGWRHRDQSEADRLREAPKPKGEYLVERGDKLFALYQTPRDMSPASPRPDKELRTILEIRSLSTGETQLEFPKMSAIRDLYETVTVGDPGEIDAFLEDFLSEE